MSLIRKSYKAVTLIEVILALIVFGIGILTILRLLTENSRWIYDIKSKDTSVLLAKEGIEIAYHIRDSNKEKDMYWNCARIDTSSLDSCGDFFYESGEGTYYLVTRDMEGNYTLSGITTTGVTETLLYQHIGNITDTSGNVLISGASRYNHDSVGGSPSIYSRYVRFSPVSGYVNDTGLILQIDSIVTYTKGGRQRSVILESLIGEIR